MDLNLSKPICFFDLETTGVDISKDRIIEIFILKIFPDKRKESKSWVVNPLIPIPKEVTAIHGFSDEDVKNLLPFKDIAKAAYHFIKDSDLAGFNSDRFDIPLLVEEFLRAGVDIDFSNRKTVDIQTIFHKMEKRTLEAAYKFYCNKTLENAHSAKADVMATYEVLKQQLIKYKESLHNDIDFLSEFSSYKKTADLAGFISYNSNKEEVFSFGKYKGQTVASVLKKDSGYFNWIQKSNFPLYTKKVLTAIRLRGLTP